MSWECRYCDADDGAVCHGQATEANQLRSDNAALQAKLKELIEKVSSPPIADYEFIKKLQSENAALRKRGEAMMEVVEAVRDARDEDGDFLPEDMKWVAIALEALDALGKEGK